MIHSYIIQKINCKCVIMPLTVAYQALESEKFDFPFRIILSGSSQSGKTHFARELLKNDLFEESVTSVRYCHPDYLSTRPVAWHDELSVPVCYQSNIPTVDELCALEPNTCIVLDDLYEECIKSKAVDYLFRVLSGKRKISVIIMTQRYFSNGKYGMNIRNQCNYIGLLRNVDARLNERLATQLNMTVPIKSAIKDSFNASFWPYVFIDASPRGQVTGVQVYTDIFSRYKSYFNSFGMKSYILTEKDFRDYFEIISKSTACFKNELESSTLTESSSANRTETDTGTSTSEPEANSELKLRRESRAKQARERRKRNRENLHKN